MRERRRLPNAWSLSELEQLLGACACLPGTMRGTSINRAVWWSSMVVFLYDSGARIGAALSVTPSDVDLVNRTVVLSADTAKTGYEQLVVISDQTAKLIATHFDPRREAVWPTQVRREALYVQLGQLLRAANLPDDRRSKFHRLRRTNATWSAKCGSIELAQRQLGHRSAQMTLDRYIDPRIMRGTQSADLLPRPKLG